jgi:hypothetical protein
MEFLRALFGDEIVFMTYGYARSEPGHPGISLHTDGQPYGSRIFGYEGSCPCHVRVLYYLDDLTTEVSPFRVVPRSHLSMHALLLMWFAYLFWNCSIGGLGNLSLYARQALGRDPKDFSGLMMALRFGCKSLGGYALGAIALRRGLRASALAAIAFIGAGVIRGWLVPGYAFLFSFGLIGAGELGGMYIPNCTLALSSLANSEN